MAFFFSCTPLAAQNLVPNPGFEEYLSCPGYYTRDIAEFRVRDWGSAGRGTPDHFHTCSQGEADVPYNWAGVSDAYEGKGYAGIYTWMMDGDYREYIQCRLLQPLIRDSTYIVEFHFKLSSYSKYSIDRIGFALTDTLVSARHDKTLRHVEASSVIQDSALTERTGYWETMRHEYRAKGGEQFLSIGNFFDNGATRYYEIQFRPAQQEMLARSAYYYVDDVHVIPKYDPLLAAVAQRITDFAGQHTELNKTYVLKNIHFEFDSYRLLSSSFEELDRVVEWMTKHPGTHVQLYGHTDDVGGERYNLRLSHNRAKSVAAYLMARGIAPERIESYGYGKAKPLIESESGEARQLNRRVEVRFTE